MSRGSSGSQISTLPSTGAIKDPEVRQFLDLLVNAWDSRSGVRDMSNGERFITLGEINGLAIDAFAGAFSSGVGAFLGKTNPNGKVPSVKDINDAIDALADDIRKSILFQLLGTELQPTDIANLRAKIDASIRETGAAILREEVKRVNADEAMLEVINIMVARIGSSEAGIANESVVRAQKDNAIAQAINTIWANVGGNQALIQDGQLASVSPAAVQATRWTQVEAAAIDPNTGQPNSAIVRQELTSYTNKANGTMNAIYSVRAQVSVGGKTVVGGFGLSATSGAGSAQGPTIDFGVRADRFYIAATSETPDANTQIGQGAAIPFMVLTSNQIVNGKVYPPGVYIKKALIGDATIGTAQIAEATITSALIQDASITNAKIANSIQSNNYFPGSSGWYIDKQGNAEFNNVTIRNAALIMTGYDSRQIHILGYYQTFSGKGGSTAVNYPVGTFIRGETFFVETGYTDYYSIADTFSKGFNGRVNSTASSWIIPSGSGNVYDLAFEVVVSPCKTWGYIGSNTAGQRITLSITPILKVLKVFTSVKINGFEWALFRER